MHVIVGMVAVVVVVVVVVVEYISILIIIIVGPLDFYPLHFCPTVQLESSFFYKPLISPHKVMGRQIGLLVCWLVFLCSPQLNLVFAFKTYCEY